MRRSRWRPTNGPSSIRARSSCFPTARRRSRARSTNCTTARPIPRCSASVSRRRATSSPSCALETRDAERQREPGARHDQVGARVRHLAERALPARSHRAGVQPGRTQAQGLRRRARAHLRHRPGLPQRRVRLSRAHQHATRGSHCTRRTRFRFPTAALTDPVTGGNGALLRGDGFDPLLIEVNTSTEYWQKGASLLHTDPLGDRDVALPKTSARLPGRRHAARRAHRTEDRPGSVRESAQPAQPGAGAACAVDRARRVGRPAASRRPPPRADDRRGTLVGPGRGRFPALPGFEVATPGNGSSLFGDWVKPQPDCEASRIARWYRRSMPTATKPRASACPTSPCRSPPTPAGIFTGALSRGRAVRSRRQLPAVPQNPPRSASRSAMRAARLPSVIATRRTTSRR